MTDPARVRALNDRPVNTDGRYVVYWAQMFRRLGANHALDHAAGLARELNRPLVVYEGLKLDYPWASARLHTFILEGMRDNARLAAEVGANYWPFVETPADKGRGLVLRLCEKACALVTDDYPQFIVPAHNRAVGRRARVAAVAVDGNGVVPFSQLGAAASAANHLRSRIHKLFVAAWAKRADARPDFASLPTLREKPPFELWRVPADVPAFVQTLPVDQSVPAVAGVPGGSVAGRAVLAEFVRSKLPRYAAERGNPDAPARNSASRLSPYLHYGHVGIQEVTEAVLDSAGWTPALVNPKTRNKDDFFCRDENVNGYLDEAITWRDTGYHWHLARLRELEASRPPESAKSWQDAGGAGARREPSSRVELPAFNFASFDFSPLDRDGTLARTLPEWARNSLAKHAADARSHAYTLAEFEAGRTHDDLWNAAQRELTATGRIHNYLRMLWGKKVLEWSPTPEAGYRVLEHLNNKYALDGRDPNSYTGLLWTFGLFDRPWPPDRPVFGNVRYMTSASAAKKFDLSGYLAWVRTLPAAAA